MPIKSEVIYFAHSCQDVIANPGLEEEQGRVLARASLKAGVQCFLWSTLPSAKQMSNGELDVFIYECMAPVPSLDRG